MRDSGRREAFCGVQAANQKVETGKGMGGHESAPPAPAEGLLPTAP